LLKNKISQLKTIITTVVKQIKEALASLHAHPHTTESNAMDTDGEKNTGPDHQPGHNKSNPDQIDFLAIINKLKNDITTITTKTRAMFHQCLPQKSNNKIPSSSVT